MRLLTVIVALIASFSISTAQITHKADSLFLNQKYTEALNLYEDIFESGSYSNAMLLRMAFIEDGSGNYPEALFFLNLYYKKTADRSVLSKIDELSQNNNLYGYSNSDFNYFSILISKYRHIFILSLSLASLFIVVLFIYKIRKSDYSIISISALSFLLILLGFANNYRNVKEGIIYQQNTMLMSGPSAAAEPIESISKGHKVEIIDEDELWTSIMWEGKDAYIRSHRLKVI